MIRFITVLALVVGGIGIIKPVAAGVLARLRVDLRSVGVDAFQRRQTMIAQVPPQCESLCDPINAMIAANNSTLSQYCLATFATGYFYCVECVGTAENATDYSGPQSTIDSLYNQCAIAGFQLPVLTFPGQNPNQPLSSVVIPSSTETPVVLPSSSQTTVSSITFAPSVIQSSTSASATTSIQAPIPTPSSSSGIRSVKTSYFNLFAVAMLGAWFYFVRSDPRFLIT